MRVSPIMITLLSLSLLSISTQAQNTSDYSGYEGYGAYQSQYNTPNTTPAPQQVQPSQETYQGRVQETQQADSLEQPLQEYIDIQKTTAELREYSGKKYDAYQVIVNNNSPHHVELLQAQVTNGLDEQYLAHEKAEEKQKKKRGFGAALKAASIGASVAGHFVPYGGTGAWAAHTAINQSSYVANSAGNAALYSANADGNVVVTGQYVKQFNNVLVTPGNKMSFQVVVPKGNTPNLAFIVKDLATNQIVDIKN